jgi:hypothetical protein
MRPIEGLLLTVGAMVFAGPVVAHPARLTPAQRALLNEVFVPRATSAPHQAQPFVAPVAVRKSMRSTLGAGDVFVLPAVTGSSLDQTHLLNAERLINGQGLAEWRSKEVSFPARGGAVDTLRLSIGGVARGRGGVVVARPDALMAPDARAFELSYTRGWPSAWSVQAGRYDLDVTPHAGFGLSGEGESAEAGALLRVGQDLQDRVIRRLGLRTAELPVADGQGRWFLFASASGRAVGVNMAQAPEGGALRPGWSSEPSTALVSDAQAGLGWRRGYLQASFGYVHRAVKNQTAMTGPANYHDSMVAFSFSIRPH